MERGEFNKRDLLFDYEQYEPSKSCYLDGRYFNIIFGDYPGLIENPLYIHINEKDELETYLPPMKIVPSDDYFGLLRVIVTSNEIRHSLVVIFDYRDEKAYIYNPDVHHPELNDILVDEIISYLSKFFDYEYFEISELEYIEKEQLKCEKHGTCNALIIFYALYFIEGLEFTDKNVQNVRKFMSAIEANYDLPEDGQADIEYLTQAQALGLTSVALLGGLALGYPYGYGYGYPYAYPYAYPYPYPYAYPYGYGYRYPYGYHNRYRYRRGYRY
jgi:hypothetical protein